jgi:cysteinyl-tRNA synthetase
VGAEGRYPLREQPTPALRIGAGSVLPVGPLRLYTCGITPYDVTHVGHASTFVWADLIASLAHATGTEAVVARNVTDVDDVLTHTAWRRGWHYDELALTQEFLFDRDMKALSVAAPTVAPHARAHVGAVVRLATALLRNGAAYEVEGFVYFRGAAVPDAAGLSPEEALALSKAYGDQQDAPHRQSVFDVAVWRPSGEQHPAWASPWSWGRPGWHAECAAMAVASLGSSVDVLLGGSDLTFPHHAYQAAMVEAATGVVPFAKTVVHVGEVRHEGRKMAKSTGNLVLVSELLERHAPHAIRLGLLHRRYDEPWECVEEVFTEAGALAARLHEVAGDAPGAADDRSAQLVRHEGVLAALTDDLDVPRAVDMALAEGPEAVRYLLDVLKLRSR